MAKVQVRVLPALIAVSLGALAFKGVDLANAAAEVAKEAKPDPAPDAKAELTKGEGEEADKPPADANKADNETAKTDAATCKPGGADYASEMGISEQEILILRKLADRRQQLEEREAAVATAEQLNAASAKKLEEQIGQLKSVEANVQTLLKAMDQKGDERMASLVKTYETMKPKDAARLFDGMDDKNLLDLAKAMKPATLALVMSSMDAKRAVVLTKMISDTAKPPAVDVKPATG